MDNEARKLSAWQRSREPLRVPAALLTLWLSNEPAKIVAGITAFVCLWATAHELWRKETHEQRPRHAHR
jgi:hypothetical protein